MRTLWIGLFLMPLTGAGCVNFADSKIKDAQVQVRADLRTAPPVTADQVNAQNAHVLIQAFWDEMDRDEAAPPPSSRSTNNRK